MLKGLSLLALGILLGFAGIGGLRFARQKPPPPPVHFHANWAIYVDGQRLHLQDERYMEAVTQCAVDPSLVRPEDRAHMHGRNDDVAHVHAPGVTWGHLLANLRFDIGDDFLYTDTGRFSNSGDRTLKFLLNGNPVASIQNLPIGNEDRLLISFGSESLEEVIGTQFPEVASDAERYNRMADPATCASASSEKLRDRLRRAFWY
jgi:hypothetical protein